MKQRQTAVVINVAAGSVGDGDRHDEQQQRLARLFQDAGLSAEIRWVAPSQLAAALDQVKAAGFERLVVGGGDGTVNLAVKTVVGTDMELGVLPLGTFNHFARDLHIPLSLEEAVRTLAGGRCQRVDVGELNGHFFVNNVSMGFYPHAVRRRDLVQQELGLAKLPAMGYALLSAFWRLPRFRSRLYVNDKERRLESSFVFLGNNRYQVEAPGVIRRQSLSQGKLCLLYSRRANRWVLLKIAVKTLFMRLDDMVELELLESREIIIDNDKRAVKLAMDGEVLSVKTPLIFRIRKGALRVRVPAG